jgi:hypothetical protein
MVRQWLNADFAIFHSDIKCQESVKLRIAISNGIQQCGVSQTGRAVRGSEGRKMRNGGRVLLAVQTLYVRV